MRSLKVMTSVVVTLVVALSSVSFAAQPLTDEQMAEQIGAVVYTDHQCAAVNSCGAAVGCTPTPFTNPNNPNDPRNGTPACMEIEDQKWGACPGNAVPAAQANCKYVGIANASCRVEMWYWPVLAGCVCDLNGAAPFAAFSRAKHNTCIDPTP